MNHFILSKQDKAPEEEYQIHLHDNWVLTLQGNNYTAYDQDDKKIIIIGDYIGDTQTLFTTQPNDIPRLRGNFYAIVVDQATIRIYNSFLSVLPIYYTHDYTYISSSVNYIRNVSREEFTIDKKFILEGLLFNYGIFNRTFYKEIQLLPSNSFLTLDRDTVTVAKHFETTSLFHENPSRGKKVVDQLSDLFISTAAHYFPNAPFDIAFTSGFDGRT